MGFKKPAIIFTAILLVLGLGLSQLNYQKMAYRHADWLIKRKVLEVFKFYSPQQDILKETLTSYMQWHKKQMLPRYINLLGVIDDRVRKLQLDDSKLNPEEVNAILLQLRELYVSTTIQLAQMIVPILLEMNDTQVDRSRTLLDRRLDQWRELKEVNKDILLKDLLYSWQANFEYILGPLNSEQLSIFDKTIFRLFTPPGFQLAYEGDLNQKLLDAMVLTQEQGRAEGEQALLGFIQYWKRESEHGPWRIELSKLATKILNLSDSKQLEEFRKKIHQWRELMVDLSNE